MSTHSLWREGVGAGIDSWEEGAIVVNWNEAHSWYSRDPIELGAAGVGFFVHRFGQHDLNLSIIQDGA